ncbi:MAG TPA: DASS family sodium-coupled anion symporter [Gemmatimonadales bacterium]|jgi:DASS family divalent anion:Na+ symporter
MRLGGRLRWLWVLLPGVLIALVPPPLGITPTSWRLLAVFCATIVGLIVEPLPGGAMVLLGVVTTAVLGILSAETALAGYADPIVWLVLGAFFFARSMIKTGLGRRIALQFIRLLGRRSLGLAYALIATDFTLATSIPSNAARAGGIIFPIARSASEAYESYPGPSASRLGTFLMAVLYQADVVICAMFLTGQASNALIARFAQQATGVGVTYAQWAAGAILPGLLSLACVPLLVYRKLTPGVTHTPGAAAMARSELSRMGPMRGSEKLVLVVFLLLTGLWITGRWHGINPAVVALLGAAILLVARVLTWEDVVTERAGWDVFFWYGGLVGLAGALGRSEIPKRFADAAASLTVGLPWWLALGGLVLVYFYSHYGFASITAHATAMFLPFLIVTLASGAPPRVAVLLLAYCSNLMASLTHYGTTPGPIYFGTGYVTQRAWWSVGFLASLVNLSIWTLAGLAWWKLLGLW